MVHWNVREIARDWLHCLQPRVPQAKQYQQSTPMAVLFVLLFEPANAGAERTRRSFVLMLMVRWSVQRIKVAILIFLSVIAAKAKRYLGSPQMVRRRADAFTLECQHVAMGRWPLASMTEANWFAKRTSKV
jgi:hypothetical protein